MTWLSRILNKKSSKEAPFHSVEATEKNILVISDIHLGEDILHEGPQKLSEYIRVLNRKLSEFVLAHLDPSEDGRQWHLVINGDMFDFIKISLLPDDSEATEMLSRALTHEEKKRGLLNTPQNTAWKLERILEIHRPIFKAFAAFLLRGNSLTLIEGNHDAEFYFPEVRETLQDYLIKLAQKESQDGNVDSEKLASLIQFRTWFDSSPGRYHIEHGHQYDEMCSFEYHLAPFENPEEEVLATPLNHRAMPYFAEILGDFSTHGVDKWNMGEWLQFSFSLGPKMLWVLTKLYVTICIELVFQAGSDREEGIQAHREKHEAQLEKLMKETPYGFETLSGLDNLRAKPADYSLWKMIHIFYLDRFMAGAATLLFVILASLVWGGVEFGSSLVGILALGGGVQWGLSKIKSPEISEVLRNAAARIADQTGARYVIFGHSHHPELVDLRELGVGRFGERAFYLNSGSWVTREILDDGHGQGMTYVEITSKGAALRRWVAANKSAELISSSDQ